MISFHAFFLVLWMIFFLFCFLPCFRLSIGASCWEGHILSLAFISEKGWGWQHEALHFDVSSFHP